MPKFRKKLMIQFQDNSQTDGSTDKRTDRSYFIGPFWLLLGIQKTPINQTKDSAIVGIELTAHMMENVCHQQLVILWKQKLTKKISKSLPRHQWIRIQDKV